MTTDQSDPSDSYDCETFQNDLGALIDQACDADVDIRGAYDVRTPHREQPDYTVEITQITNQPSTERLDRQGRRQLSDLR